MILILGGAASGKRTYLLSLGYGPEDIADGVLDEKKVLYGLEKLVFADPEGAQALLPALLQKEVEGAGHALLRPGRRSSKDAGRRITRIEHGKAVAYAAAFLLKADTAMLPVSDTWFPITMSHSPVSRQRER